MSKIDTNNWGKFILGDLFSFKRGNSKKLQLLKKGETPIIAAAGYNQGIAGLYDIDAEYTNKITVSCNGAGCGSTFYHPYSFGINGDAMVLLEKEPMSDNVKLYISCLLNGILTRKYSYQEKCSPSKAEKEKLKLPIDKNGKPNFEFMEQYMQNRINEVKKSLMALQSTKLLTNLKISTSEWKEFKIGDMFDIHPTKAYKLTNANLFEVDGVNPIVVNSSFNNGIGGYTNLKTTEKGGIITFSDTTTSAPIFYQDKPFVGYSHIQGMYPIGKYKDCWNKYSLLFFLSIFKKQANNLNYDYVNKFTRESAKLIFIKLPVDKNGNPDFEYMSNYMKSLQNQKQEDINKVNKFIF